MNVKFINIDFYIWIFMMCWNRINIEFSWVFSILRRKYDMLCFFFDIIVVLFFYFFFLFIDFDEFWFIDIDYI